MVAAAAVVISAASAASCASDDPGSVAPSPSATVPSATVPSTSTVGTEGQVDDPALRDELLAMMEEDQAEQTGEVTTNNYRARTDRLAEILDEHGWPTIDLVGEEGSTAAWVIAQHADLDPAVQARALDLLRSAAADGQASGGDLAYLEDRVAVARGEPQVYGTQVRCGDDGVPTPATPITDEAGLEARRAAVGLDPYADYLAEMNEICAANG